MSSVSKPPALLIFGGLDPSGGAGLTADVQTASAFGIHPIAVATTLTAQGLDTFEAQHAVETDVIAQQARAAVKDFHILAVKTGAIPDHAALEVIGQIVTQLQSPHVVMDPVRQSTSGGELDNGLGAEDVRNSLTTLRAVVTPNRQELDQLSACAQPAEQARELMALGARAVLLTDGDGRGAECEHTLYRLHADTPATALSDPAVSLPSQGFRHERLPGAYRGTGCTLSTALACALMRGAALPGAVQQALDYTLGSLRSASIVPDNNKPGIPRRVIPT